MFPLQKTIAGRWVQLHLPCYATLVTSLVCLTISVTDIVNVVFSVLKYSASNKNYKLICQVRISLIVFSLKTNILFKFF